MNTSLIIITRNRSHLLQNALNSIMIQSLFPSEIIIVDNASSDDTKHVIELVKQKFNQIPVNYVYEDRIGRAKARNRGIQVAKYELILFTDDDCILEKEWVKKMVTMHLERKDLLVIYGKMRFVGHNRLIAKVSSLLNDQFNLENVVEIDRLTYSKTFDTANCSIKREFFNQFGIFNENLHATQDVELASRVSLINKIILYFPDVVVTHVARSNLYQLIKQNFVRGYYQLQWSRDSFFKLVGNFISFPLYVTKIIKSENQLSKMVKLYLFISVLFFNLGRFCAKMSFK